MAYSIGDYPLPSNAVYAWIAQGCICIGLPGRSPEDKGHTVRVPLEKCSIEFNDSGTAPLTAQLGWAALLRLLHDRAQETVPRRIAEGDGNVTQYVMEQWLKSGHRVKSITEDGQHIATMEELGL